MPTPNNAPTWGKWFFIATWLIVLGLGSLVFNKYLSEQRNPNRQIESMVDERGVREVILQRNHYGQYVASGWINNQPVVMMLDTGASDVSIPSKLAKKLGLVRGAASRYSTANGVIIAYRTVIDNIRIGNIVLHDVRASINPAMNDLPVLVGMSFLKQIEFTQKGNQLILRQ